MINLDFSNVQERKPLEPGVYSFEVKEASEAVSKSGKPMLKVTLKESETGTLVFDNFVLEETCLWKLKQFFTALGLDTSGSLDIDPDELIGYTATASVVQEEYNGNVNNKIKRYTL